MRNTHTPNEIIEKDDHYEMVLYNIKCEEIARALFSKQWLSVVKKYKWCIDDIGYCNAGIDGKTTRLHKLIKGKPPKGLVTDHKDRNKLNNRDENLRFITQQQNTRNSKMQSNNKSGVTGVYWNKIGKRWVAQIKINKKTIYLCSFRDKNKAIKLRKEAEEKYYG